MQSERYQLGLVGLSVMGRNLALNFLDQGISVVGYNREPELTRQFLDEARGKPATGVFFYRELCELLERPRKVLLLIQAGPPVDEVIKELLPHLEPGDMIIDGGNSHFRDSIRRERTLQRHGIRFVGMGISGGEEGARNGPCLMPGGSAQAYAFLAPLLNKIAARAQGEPCCLHIGENGAGHFVKMVHNGIEYADMQLICEAYYLLRQVYGLSVPEMAAIFRRWNDGPLAGYLMEITAEIMEEVDDLTGKPMLDVILGRAGSKGTGKWSVIESLELATPLSMISEALTARSLSALTQERRAMAACYPREEAPVRGDLDAFAAQLEQALYAAKIVAYSQGFSLMQAAAREYDWTLDLGGIARIFRGGCIIRAAFLDQISAAYRKNPQLSNLLLDDYFSQAVTRGLPAWREVVTTAIRSGISLPVFSAGLASFDAWRDPDNAANLLQAQRDYFGAHTFQRTDQEGTFHHHWQ